MSTENLGIATELGLRRKLYGDYAYQAPAVANARSHRITVNCATGERSVETIEPPAKKVALPPPPAPTPLEHAEMEIRSLRQKLDEANQILAAVPPAPEIEDVQTMFCAELNAAGWRYRVSDLKCPFRYRSIAHPRQVCVALVRHLCNASLPRIGKAFGGRDHTTIMNSVKKAPDIMAANAVLREVHARTLAHFEAAK